MTKPVTQEQIDACTRVIDEAKHEVFYLVATATGPNVTYQVHYNTQYSRFTCTCKAGYNGFTCWHLRAAIQHATDYANAKRAEQEAQERERQERRLRPTSASIARDAQRFAPRAFSLLK